MALVIVKNEKITKKQKIAFYRFVKFIYKSGVRESMNKYRLDEETVNLLKMYGFCYMITVYFGYRLGNDTYTFARLFPELNQHKPSHINGGFWFPIRTDGKQTSRIAICVKVLKELI